MYFFKIKINNESKHVDLPELLASAGPTRACAVNKGAEQKMRRQLIFISKNNKNGKKKTQAYRSQHPEDRCIDLREVEESQVHLVGVRNSLLKKIAKSWGVFF